MLLDLVGRISNTKLAPSNCLNPLFEAIVNSIHAIEDAGVKDGKIRVDIDRAHPQRVIEFEGSAVAPNPIQSFVVEDNGIGFTDENYRSFQTSDTTAKATKGGKGVGRLLWLKAFTRAEIESTYQDDGSHWKRTFTFTLSKTGVVQESKQKTDSTDRKTIVALVGFKSEFERKCPKSTLAIARRIVEHCLDYFVLDACPSIVLHDKEAGDKVDLNRLFAEQLKVESKSETIKIKDQKFRLIHMLVASSHDDKHRIFFCAHKRAVKSELLAEKIPNLLPSLRPDGEEKSTVYTGYLSGSYLDETVNAERTSFAVSDNLELEFDSDPSWHDLVEATITSAAKFLSPYTEQIKRTKEEQIEDYVRSKAPQYRSVVRHRREWLDEIQPNLSEERLDIELYKIDKRYDAELKEASTRFLSDNAVELKDTDDYAKAFEKLVTLWSERGTEKLAEYVTHRKTILAFLDKRLEVRSDGRYPLEASIHQLIFPLHKTSDDVRPEQMNLWIIDERLAYHYYLASDIPLKKQRPLQSDSKSRPDLLIFDKPIAFSESTAPFNAIVIIEFKRPVRNDYDDSDNPIAQIYKYVEDIKGGKIKDRHGRPLSIPLQTPFYSYIICDLTENLRAQARNAGLTLTPDSLGFFGYNSNYGTYVEIISFDKLVGDAKKRNAVLFDKLGLGR